MTADTLHAAALALLGVISTAAPAWAQRAELISRTELRVCADPNNLPFSNQAHEGFENRIAELIGADLGLPVSYVWFPQVVGFVRNTLRARECDLVMGAVAGDTVMDTTNAYYHTGYMIVTRAAEGITATAIGDPALADRRIGLVAATPPTDLAVRHGLMPHVRAYSLAVDTRAGNPARAMLQDLADGAIDVALVWGPVAGYAIRHDGMTLHAAFLQPEPDAPRLDYRIAMGVRANEPEWRRRINQAITRQQAGIDQVLAEYGVPLLDEQNRPRAAPAAPVPASVPEPDGFRMDDYRAPVPATVAGGVVVHAPQVRALLDQGGAVLIDVLPAPRRPDGMRPGMPWLPAVHRNLPASLWWPEIGRGALPPAFEATLRARLAELAAAHPGSLVVFYCLPDCWMSWNAAKRAASYGIRAGWFPEGVDAWQAAGLPLQDATPEFLD